MRNSYIYFVLAAFAIAAIFMIVMFDGTGDSGDSIMHYLFAKYAPDHPFLFFDHWAKPVYVLMASPFAQFGFTGIKIFNAIITFFTIYFTYMIAVKLNITSPYMVAFILLFSPLYFVLTFSGLTEPLFALFISCSIYAVFKNKYVIASILISFLPFVRSEGLIFIPVFALYFLYAKKWLPLAFLLTGHVVYSFLGYFVFNDFLWVFNKIPYAHLSSIYGSGSLFHYVGHLIYVVGVPIYILFAAGIIKLILLLIKKEASTELYILVFIGFLAFFIAHSLFWYLGVFNSMGLSRVFIGIIPLIALIALLGYNFITEDIMGKNKLIKVITHVVLIVYIIIFPFTSNPASVDWKNDFRLTKDQQLAKIVSDSIVNSIGKDHRFVYTHPYLSEVLKIDHFDSKKRVEITNEYLNHIKKGDLIIWENWLSVVERGITKEMLDSIPDLHHLFEIKDVDDGRDIHYSVYQKIY